MIVAGPVVDDLSRLRVIGWVGSFGSWVDPAAVSDEPCPICEEEFGREEG